MIANYFRIAFRTLAKNKIYSFINISGFAIGITCSLMILLWVYDELMFDAWIPKYDRVYRLMTLATYDGSVHVWNANPIPSAEAIKESSASVMNTAITDWGGDHLLALSDRADRSGIKKHGLYASESFLTIFGHKMIYGDPETALKDMKSIVLTKSTAKVLFGDQNPMDKIVRFDDNEELKVTAVIEDIPDNSNIKFDYLVTFSLYETIPWVKGMKESWDSNSFPVYVELRDPSEAESVISKIAGLPAMHAKPGGVPNKFWLHPISRWRLHNQFDNGAEAGGGIVYVKTFGLIAGLVLFIACVNFMNLATARAEKRAVEVGVRKSVGSRKSDLISQFIWESIVTTAIAFVAGLIIAQLLMPFYNQLVSKQLSIPYTSPVFIGGSMAVIFGVGILAGSYPAFYLSAFKPVTVLKGGKGTTRGGGLPRKILVTIQFGFSMMLILATIVVYQQIQHTRNRDMGFNADNLMMVGMTDDIQKNFKAIKTSLLQTGVVESVTKSNQQITNEDSWNAVEWPGKPAEQKFFFSITATEYDFVKTLGLKLIEGRDFSEDFKSDSSGLILNRAAVDLIGLKDPIGSKIIIPPNQEYHVIGVIENTVSGDPNSIPGPGIIQFNPSWAGVVTLRTEAGVPVEESIEKIAAVFKTYSPAYPFEFRFADDEYQRKFTTINLTSRLASIFAIFTLAITGLGLFGLAAFTAAQRTKEMGIRKVMGASVQQLVQLVTKDFSWLVVIAFVVSAPIAWWMIGQYLQQYAYRVDVQWWIFPLTGLIALLFAIIIVSTQALRAARSNPAQSLRNE
jgi:putative ABC transport system permease protein